MRSEEEIRAKLKEIDEKIESYFEAATTNKTWLGEIMMILRAYVLTASKIGLRWVLEESGEDWLKDFEEELRQKLREVLEKFDIGS